MDAARVRADAPPAGPDGGVRSSAAIPSRSDDGRELLHLALNTDGDRVHLLIADLPGEPFSRLADNQISPSQIRWLDRADKLVLIVDGARLCVPETRGTTVTRARQLLERLTAGWSAA